MKLKCNGAEHTFTAKFNANRHGGNLTLSSTAGWRGSASVDGKAVVWAVSDCNLNNKIDFRDTALIDMNGDNQMNARDERIILKPQSLLAYNSKWHSIAPDSAGSQLRVESYAGPMHKLAFDCSKVVKEKKAPVSLLVMYGDGKRLNIADVSKGTDVAMPQITYSYVAGTVPMSPSLLRFTMRNFNLQKDTLLILEKPTLNINVNQGSGKVHVNQKVIAPHGISYNMKRGKPGPLVEFFTAKDKTKPLIKGNMAYG